jgi:hypothetical protein
MKMKSILVLAALAALPGCLGPTIDSEEAIGEASQAWYIAPPPPIGNWHFNNCDGDVVTNNGSQWLAATLYNGASCGPGFSGSAGIFDGIDDRAEIPYDSALDFTNAMTVSAWVKSNDTSVPQTIVSKWYAPNSYMLWLSNGRYRFSVELAGGERVAIAATGTATAGVFSHVTGVFNGATLKIYVNGDLKGSTDAAGTLQASTRPVTIGNHSHPYAGAIDEVQLYDVALSDAQVAEEHELYCSGCSGSQCCQLAQ